MFYKGSAISGNGGGSGAAVWGAITGTLENQTDLQNALNEKQASLSSEQITATNSGITSALVTQIGTNESAISTINGKIPSAASTENQLADKSFVNSSIATNTANFIGTYEDVATLEAYSGTVTNNDYAFVINSVVEDNGGDWATFADLDAYSKAQLTNYDYAWVINGAKFDLYRFDVVLQTWGLRVTNTDKASVTLNTVYNRYKATVANNTVTWDYEYTLNNSSFTAVQWAAINSGATDAKIGQIATNTTNIGTLQTQAGNSVLTTTAQTLSGAINELDAAMPAAQVNADWTAVSGVAQILNKPSLAAVATSGSYTDLSNTPTIPSVGNATITLKQGETTVGSFTTNTNTDATFTFSAIPTVDQTYNAASSNPQSGVAIAGAGFMSTSDIDASTISLNSSNKLQSVGVVNQNSESGAINPLKFWEGSATEYNTGGGIKDTYYGWSLFTHGFTTALNLPSSANWRGLAYGDGRFVTVAYDTNSKKAAYSSDGINWTSSSLPSEAAWYDVTYGDGKFVAVARGPSNKSAYSTDGGETWTETTMPRSAAWYGVTYGDGKFVAIVYGSTGIGAYSTDGGETWTETTMPSGTQWSSVAYGNGKFVAVSLLSSNKIAYSSDGIHWAETTLTNQHRFQNICYGNGKFVALNNNNNFGVYSTDGINWTEAPERSTSASKLAFGDGKFIAMSDSNSSSCLYSYDGINWLSLKSTSSSFSCSSVTYGDGKFVGVEIDSQKNMYVSSQIQEYYTTDETPTTSSQVYSAPDVTSTLTITSFNSTYNRITLSDGSVHQYNAGGNVYSYYTIGETYPNIICNVEGVGVKVGNTVIADYTDTTLFQTKSNLVTSISSQSTDTQYASAKCVYDIVGNVETLLSQV